LAIHRKSDEIIGCTSIFPRKVWFKDNVTLGSVGGDAFVDPRFRRRGIANELHRVCHEEMKEAGIKFMYGFPTPANFGAFLKVGSYYPGNFRLIKFLLRGEPIIEKLNLGQTLSFGLSKIANTALSLYINFKLSKSTHQNGNLKKISKFDYRFDKLAVEVIPYFNICCVRDSDYLNWRYFRNPQKVHTIFSYEENDNLHGFAAIEFYGNRSIIFDFFVRNENELAQSFICSLIKFVISKGLTLITTLINPVGPYMRYFLQCGFRFGYPSTKMPLTVLATNDNKEIEYLKSIENWYLTYGDLDAEAISTQGYISSDNGFIK
jgi:hypothetical protein